VRAWLAICLMLGGLFMVAPARAASLYDSIQLTPGPNGASVPHSAMRATTYKIGTTAMNIGLLSYAFGSVAGGGAVAVAAGISSWLIFTANDYLWDRYGPPLAQPVSNGQFDPKASTWRTTLKFLTYKPLSLAQKYFWVYVYSGSVATSFTWGSITAAANAAWFYVNDMAWDWYDWRVAAANRQAIVAPRTLSPAR